MKKIEVCLTPALLSLYDLSDSVVVVIDIFRATSAICCGIANGAFSITPVATVEECLKYKGQGFLLAAERNGIVVEGFDFGNSPFSYVSEKVAGKNIVLTTTNGTYALHKARSADEVIIGSFLNITAVCEYLTKKNKNVLLLCAGWKDKVNLEDTLFAGAVVSRIKAHFDTCCDSSLLAEDAYKTAETNLQLYMEKSSHRERLKKLGIEKDIAFCLNIDLIDSVPILNGDKIVKSGR